MDLIKKSSSQTFTFSQNPNSKYAIVLVDL
jgi:hypothetical protein